MKKKLNLFEENTVLGGYSIAVRDDWSLRVKRVHISEEEMEAYEQEFGDKILKEQDFVNWLVQRNKD